MKTRSSETMWQQLLDGCWRPTSREDGRIVFMRDRSESPRGALSPRERDVASLVAIGMGNPVLSVAAGEVVLTGEHFFAGTSVYVDHGDGLISMYFHLSEIGVEVGQTVAKGDEVGKIGSTGRSTGPHLHLGLRWKGARIDPEPLLSTLDVVDVP